MPDALVEPLNKMTPDATSLLLIDFHATWCEPCKWAEPVVADVLKHLGQQVTFRKIDIDEEPELAREYHVLSVPTFVLLKNGKEIWRMRGFDTPSKMIRAIEEKLKP